MSDSGSHGGATPSEINSPLLILPIGQRTVGSKGTLHLHFPLIHSLMNHCQSRLSNFPDVNSVHKIISQIDIAPTISAFLNLPIPKNNLGRVIVDALDYPPEDRAFWLFSNVHQVIKVFGQYSATSFETGTLWSAFFLRWSFLDCPPCCLSLMFQSIDRCSKDYKEAVKLHKKISKGLVGGEKEVLWLYSSVINCVKHKVTSKLINYDMYSIVIAIVSFLLVRIPYIFSFEQFYEIQTPAYIYT